MRKILIVIDMQNDFIDGALGTKEAETIVPAVVRKIKSYPADDVYATRDTHPENYLDTQEGEYLPVRHCIKGTEGWQLCKEVAPLIPEGHIFDKPTFGSVELAVVSNALLLKAVLPEMKISVDASCCAGVTPQKHEAALETMRSCQIQGI